MKQESGRSMIEMLGVLAIMGIITVGAFSLLRLALNSQKKSQVTEDVVTIVTQVRQLLGGYDDFSNIDNSMIFGAIGVSNKNPYGGAYTVSVNPSNARQFIVGIDGLPMSDCEYLATKAWTDSVGYISSNHTESGATGNCKNSGTNNSVQIVFGD
ncbi:MAG: type II secretion system protein [Alphaproteobacteria bacterium]|nr:type II secretion system protein [Alphaproteobacteria bacterium]